MQYQFVLHCLVDVGDNRELFPLDADQGARFGGNTFAFGDHHGHVIPLPQTDLGLGIAAAGADEDRLVIDAQTVFVAGHVPRREDSDDAGQGLGRAGVQRQHPGVRLAAE